MYLTESIEIERFSRRARKQKTNVTGKGKVGS